MTKTDGMVLHNCDTDDLVDYVEIFYEMTQMALTVEENWQMLLHHC